MIQTEPLSPEASAWLAQRCRLVVAAPGSAAFDQAIGSAAGLVIRTYTTLDERLLERAGKLRVIGRAGAGLDNIDVEGCRRRSIQVVYTPDANTQAVVEYVLCLIGDVVRPRVALSRAVGPEEWGHLRQTNVAAQQMNELTLGILGLGRVGKRLAAAARAIGFTVVFNDLVEIPVEQRFGAASVAVGDLFARSDVLSVHIDGRASNRGFVKAKLINSMKGEIVLINTSRGLVVDNLALAEFLRRNPKAWALLDVHEPEPFGADYPLLGLPNAMLYPHLASRTRKAMEEMSWVVRDVAAVLEGRAPRFRADEGAQPRAR